jgi:serine/threonine protein kinase/Tfp pilus assembly protein PilF
VIGSTISHYKIVEKLGEGGMGVVYKAHDTKLNRDVALKFLPHGLSAHEPERARFLQEAQAAAALNHPNICTIHDIAQEGDDQFIVMEYVDGVALREKIADGRIQLADCISYAIQIGDALQEAHSKGIVHRDIKAENIMVNSKNQIKVMDFGLAKLKGSMKLTRTSSTVGTLAYMAPEQIQGGEVDARSDIFSFGVVLYEMLTGHAPFRGEHEAAMVYSIVNEEPTPLQKYLPEASSELVHILNRALEKDPEDRYQSLHDMVIDLRRLKKETSKVLRPAEQFVRETGASQKGLLISKWFRPSLYGASAVLVLALLLIFVWPSIQSQFFATRRISVLVIPFENQTGDPQFDKYCAIIPNFLITSLEQSTVLRVRTWERMRDLLKEMGKSDTSTVTAQLGFDLCRRDSVQALVTGSFVKAGDMFLTDVKVLDAGTKELLKGASSKGKGEESILDAQIDDLARKIAVGIGVPERKVIEEQKAIREVTTSSLEAYNFYLRGVQEYEKGKFRNATRFLRQAVGLDSSFAMAHLRLARAYSFLGDQPSGHAAYERASTFSNRASRRERLYIDAAVAAAFEGDGAKSRRLLKQLESEFPNEKEAHFRLYFLGGDESLSHLQKAIDLDPQWGFAINQLAYEYMSRGNYEAALKLIKQYASLSPGDPNPYDAMGKLYFYMGKLGESIAAYKQTLEIDPDFGSQYKLAYLCAMTENYSEATRWLSTRAVDDKDLHLVYVEKSLRCFLDIWLGRYSDADVLATAACRLFREAGYQMFEASAKTWVAVIQGNRGQFERARNTMHESSGLLPAARFEQSGITELFINLTGLEQAKLFLREGQVRPVEKMLAELPPAPQNMLDAMKTWQLFDVHLVQGELLLARGETDKAISHFRNPRVFPAAFILSTPDMMGIYNWMFARDGLARAYVKKGDLDSAIAEYERITQFNPASNDRRLIHPLHHYELAKLYERKGMKEKAIARYERFLSIWKNADADRPEPRDARAQLAKIRGK